MSTKTPRPAPTPPRRRPRQSRAHHTAQALREAFVRLLVERGYAAITIREVVAVAGTGLGSFYEYFASKEDLGRVCIHLRTKELLLAMRTAAARHAGQPLDAMVEAVVASQVELHRDKPREWGEHYMLERLISGPDAYRKMFERFVSEWSAALQATSETQAVLAKRQTARTCQAIIYGLFSHAFIGTAGRPDLQALATQARVAIVAYLRAAATGLPADPAPAG
ncbi:MAG: TetR/AcrR family transcriptional regulator [Proteobacteria bacterium]|nr:TetR/AcrR family transcriptional regulator [Pseudomonadota bacterium]